MNRELKAALDQLFARQTFGIKLGLDPITGLLEELGNPHRNIPAIHVAGTNGKGSVCAMIASVLQEGGLKVGLYTSPHLVDFAERIRINGAVVPEERLADYAREMMPMIERHNCTFFEGTTAIALRYFAEQQVDVAVLETGMGGRLDATNVVTPTVSVVTSISLDHTRHLGNTLEEIAGEKAGIIKAGTPALVGRIAPRLRTVFEHHAGERQAPLRFIDDFCRAVPRGMTFDHVTASFMVDERELSDVRIGLTGRHQIENACTAIGALELVREQFGITDSMLRQGLEAVRDNTGIQGRFETVQRRPRIVLDVAHNPDGVRTLVETLRELLPVQRSVRFIYGAVREKDVAGVLHQLQPYAVKLYAVRADNHRSLPADEIAHHSEQEGIATEAAPDIRSGIETALAEVTGNEVVMICGSFFVVGEALAALRAMDNRNGPIGNDLSRIKDGSPAVTRSRSSGKTRRLPSDTTTKKPARHTSVKHWQEEEQPRERLMRQGATALSNAELLAILIRTGRKGEDVLQVSRKLLHRFTSLEDLAARDYRELQTVEGIGPTKAVTLAAAFEMGKRLKVEPFTGRVTITGPEDVARIFVPKLRMLRKEQFHVVMLNTANQVIRYELISEGNLNSSIVHPREVFRTAIIENAAAIIGLHNHPSGNPTPSKEDIAVTRQLVEAGRTLGIPFHDHMIIAGEEYVSMAERGYI